MSREELCIEQTRDAILTFGRAVSSQLAPLLQQIGIATQMIYEAFWQSYREAGMPYGETEEGLLRWMKEVGEVERMQMESERILAHHQMLANFRTEVNNEQ